MLEKYTLKNKTILKIIHKFCLHLFFFLLQNAINTIYNLCSDYWDLITKFWLGS